MIKAVFFDVDGTLLSLDKHVIPPSAKEALFKLRENGIKVFVSTGRHPLMLDAVKEIFDFDGYITLNGQIAFDHEEVLRRNPIPKDKATSLITKLLNQKIPCIMLEEGDVHSSRINSEIQSVMSGLGLPTPKNIASEAPIFKDIYQVIVILAQERDSEFASDLDGVELVRWNEHFLDVVPEGGGKHNGVQAILEKYQLSPEEAMAFGDGENDITMLGYVGTGVALGGASARVKASANYVTDPLEEDGVAKALRHFHLID